MNEDLIFIQETNLHTDSGILKVRAYRNTQTMHEPIALVSKLESFASDDVVPVRVHDACFTSEVLGSLHCDCREQLHYAKRYIQQNGGVVIYMHQEGRGIGLANKIAAYALQEQGMDTVEANRALHLPDDARDYNDAAAILKQLGIQHIALLTNNPRKIAKMTEVGIEVMERLAIQVPSSPFSQRYLKTKASKMSHLLDFSDSIKED